MNLVLWRHAEAADGAPDIERPLTPRGEKQAGRVGLWLRQHLPAGFQVVASPAVRTRQTAAALDPHFRIDDRLAPWREAADYLAVAGWTAGAAPAQDGCLVLVGHQPIIGWAASMLLTGDAIGWSVKKGAAWWLHSREREGRHEAVLRTVLNPDML